MAHFAELDENNQVLRVIVVSNYDTSDRYGNEKEHIGAAFCERLYGGRWVQTSFNGKIRGRFASIGSTYNEEADLFVGDKPYPSWVIDKEIADWVAPVTKPDDGNEYEWNEDTTSWDLVTPE